MSESLMLQNDTRASSTRAPAVASPWHSALFLASLAILSVASAFTHGFANVHIPGVDQRLSGYLTVLAIEWLWTLLVWDGLRRRGLSLGVLIGGAWPRPWAMLRDLGLALAFMAVIIPLDGALMSVINPNAASTLSGLLPTQAIDMAVWIVLSVTGGFCEELLFRGFLMRQLEAWTGSRTAAIFGQGIIFGLGHAYYGAGMVVVMVHGCLLGFLAHWRKNLRPGMLAHGMQDFLGGLLAFISR